MLTLIVGTDAVRRGHPAPATLPATWNPRSREDAAGRARAFALQAATVWNAESVIGYVSSVTKAQPPLISEALANTISDQQSREDKLVALCDGIGHPRTEALALVRAALVWRNRLTHIHASNRLSQDVVASLRASDGTIAELYQGLKVHELVERIHVGAPPRLKEAAAMIRAAAVLTRSLDERICGQIDVDRYLRQVVLRYLESSESRIVRATGLWGGTPQQNRRAILNVAEQAGMRTDGPEGVESELPSMTPKAGVACLGLVWRG